jgi:tripartite-type tricarboxylate transporter receptor subunit TctC
MSRFSPTGLKRRALLTVALAAPFAARAETYPSKPIRVILPAPVGGLIDIAGRAISDTMQRELGQPWMIDPRPGANGIMAGQMFLAAPSDGYTLFFTVSGLTALPFIMKVPFDTVVDFKPIAMVGISTALLCVPPQSPVGTVARVRGPCEEESRQAQLPQLGQRHRRAPAARAAQDQVRPRRHLDLL